MSEERPKDWEGMARRKNARAAAKAPLLAFGGLVTTVTAAEVQRRWEVGELEARRRAVDFERRMARHTVAMRRLVRHLDPSGYFHLKVLWPRQRCPQSSEYRADYWHQALTFIAARHFGVSDETRSRVSHG